MGDSEWAVKEPEQLAVAMEGKEGGAEGEVNAGDARKGVTGVKEWGSRSLLSD